MRAKSSMSPPNRRHDRDFDKIIGIDGQYVIHSAADDARADSHNIDTFGDSIDTATEWVPLANPFPARNVIEAEEVEAQRRFALKHERHRRPAPPAFEPGSRAPEVLNLTCSLLSSATPVSDPVLVTTPALPLSAYIRPFTKADRKAIAEGAEDPVWTPKLAEGHPELMTIRDREGIMKMHLTQMASSAASAVQDFRGKFILGARKNSEDDGKQKTAYASVHHPRKNLQGASTSTVVLGDKFSALTDIEDAMRLILRVEAVDDFIKDLHPLATEALENSFSARSDLLAEAVGKISGNFASILSYRKGGVLIDRIFAKLAAALNPGENPFAMRIRRIAIANFQVSLDTLDLLLSKFLVFGGSSGKLHEICEIFGKQYNLGNRFGKNVEEVFAELGSEEISRFLINHPMGVKVFTNLLPIYTSMTAVVSALCQSCERLHAKVIAAVNEEKLQDLWNLLVAVLQRANEEERVLIQAKIGTFLQNKIQQ